jgi:hypothetical protein
MKITKSQLKQIIKEELEGMLAKPTDSKKWSTITMGAKVQFPEWEMLSGEGRMERLKTALENKGLRAAFDEAYEKINNLPLESEYSEGKPIALDFFEKLRGV